MLHHCLDLVLTIDSHLLIALRAHAHTGFLDATMPWVTYLGDGLVLFLLSCVIYLLENGRGKRAAAASVKVLLVVGIAVQIIKHLVGRPRPFGGSPDSFPSGHTAVAFALAQIYGAAYRRFRWGFIMMAILVGLSRLYLAAHYPLDVIAGMIIGTTIAAAFLRSPANPPPYKVSSDRYRSYD